MMSLVQTCRKASVLAWACLAIPINAGSASEKFLYSFEGNTNTPGWQIVNDDVMGGVSTSRFEVLTNGVAVFSGVVSLENNGGFASLRSSPMRQDLTGTDAFVLRVRGDGRRYKFTVRTETGFNAPNYQADFTPKPGEWEELRLPFKDFVPTFRGRVLTAMPPLNPSKTASLGILISDNQAGPFRLELSWIKAAAR